MSEGSDFYNMFFLTDVFIVSKLLIKRLTRHLHATDKGQSQDLNPGSAAPEPDFATALLYGHINWQYAKMVLWSLHMNNILHVYKKFW